MLRADVIKLIENGKKIRTCPDNPCIKKNGAEVRVFTYKGNKYLRSVKDDAARDNLGTLPDSC